MATEKRLIDANALFPGKILAVNIKNPMETVEDLMNRINNAPTVDAVEVVRCKDCRGTMSGFMHPSGRRLCERISRWVDGNDYCSCGERRNNE